MIGKKADRKINAVSELGLLRPGLISKLGPGSGWWASGPYS